MRASAIENVGTWNGDFDVDEDKIAKQLLAIIIYDSYKHGPPMNSCDASLLWHHSNGVRKQESYMHDLSSLLFIHLNSLF